MRPQRRASKPGLAEDCVKTFVKSRQGLFFPLGITYHEVECGESVGRGERPRGKRCPGQLHNTVVAGRVMLLVFTPRLYL